MIGTKLWTYDTYKEEPSMYLKKVFREIQLRPSAKN
jgi:hypothetical protein